MQIYNYIINHSAELAIGAASVAGVIGGTELFKPWIVDALIEFGQSKRRRQILMLWSFLLSYIPVRAFDFRAQFQSLTDVQIDLTSAVLLGMLITWGASQVVWQVFHEWQPIRVARLLWYRRVGVMTRDIEALDNDKKKENTGSD
jgi:hypothetical protein